MIYEYIRIDIAAPEWPLVQAIELIEHRRGKHFEHLKVDGRPVLTDGLERRTDGLEERIALAVEHVEGFEVLL